jgi:hypothetical protein
MKGVDFKREHEKRKRNDRLKNNEGDESHEAHNLNYIYVPKHCDQTNLVGRNT